jgi:hypothetical protein
MTVCVEWVEVDATLGSHAPALHHFVDGPKHTTRSPARQTPAGNQPVSSSQTKGATGLGLQLPTLSSGTSGC